MANKRFNDLPAATSATLGDVLAIDGTTTRKITIENLLEQNLVAIRDLTSAADKGIQFTGLGTAATYDLTAAGKAILDDADATAQRATLGLVIGTDVQAYDADLAALAANASTGLWSVTGAGTGSVRTLTAPAAGITVTNGNGVSGNPTLALANDLAAIEALASTGIARRTGSDAWSVGTAVSNAELATMAAFTLKGNATGSSATPTDIDIAALTTKASPAAGDYIVISDQAASGALKKTPVSAVASAGSVGSYNGRTGAVTATGTDVPLRSYIAGLTLSTAGSSSSFGIAIGVATDSTGVSMMSLGSAYTKTTSSWAVGSATGSLDTGTIAANTWYHAFLIKRTDTGVVDVLISTSATSPTLPTNYTLFRRIGSMATNGSSQWAKFVQVDDEFLWTTPVNDVTTTTLGTTPTLYTLSVPTGVQVKALFRGFISSATSFAGVVINSPDETSTAINTPAGNLTAQIQAASTNALFTLNLRTNTSAQIRAVASAASTSLTIATYGWVDRRGREL